LRKLGEMLKAAPKATGARGIGTSAVPKENHTLAASIKVEALRKLGEMLQAAPKARGEIRRGTEMAPRESDTATLAELGLTKKESAVAQKLAALPEVEFRHVASLRHSANWRKVGPRPLCQVRQLRGHHCAPANLPRFRRGVPDLIGLVTNATHKEPRMSADPSVLRAEFYSLPPEAVFDRPTAAAVRYVSPATLEAEAIKGGGPPYTRIGRRALYRKSDLLAWMEKNGRTVENTAQLEAA